MSEIQETVARLRELSKAATPGPWDNDYDYTMGTVFRRPNDAGVPVGQCYCCRNPENELVKARKSYHVHRHPHAASFGYEHWHHIHNDQGIRVAGNWDYEDGGIISREDAALIVAMRNALPLLLDALDPPKRRRAQQQPDGAGREG